MSNLPQGFDIYLVNVKTMRKIVQIFVTFSKTYHCTILNTYLLVRADTLISTYKNAETFSKEVRTSVQYS